MAPSATRYPDVHPVRITLVVALLLSVSAGTAKAHDPYHPWPQVPSPSLVIPAGQFVTVSNGEFQLEGIPFRFVGTNAYFMVDAAMYGSRAHTVQTMHLAQDLGFRVVRMWGFMNADGGGSNNESGDLQQIVNQRLLQPLPRVYNDGSDYCIRRESFRVGRQVYYRYDVQRLESAGDNCAWTRVRTPDYFSSVDYVIATAQAHDVRLIFTLGNNWKHYGGADQLQKWCAPGEPRELFFTDPECISLYKDNISYVLTRFNKLTQREYRQEPAIFSWEVMNEARCPGCPFQGPDAVLATWMATMAGYIKSLRVGGVGALVGTGEEGYGCTWTGTWSADPYTDTANIRLHPWMYNGAEGTCYEQNTAIDAVDYGSFHMWPEYWRFADGSVSEAKWIKDHVDIAGAKGKPAVLGEFGSSRRTRDEQFDRWLTAVEESGGHGALVWQIMCPACENHATRLEVIYPPVTNESEVLCKHAKGVDPLPQCGAPTDGAYLPDWP